VAAAARAKCLRKCWTARNRLLCAARGPAGGLGPCGGGGSRLQRISIRTARVEAAVESFPGCKPNKHKKNIGPEQAMPIDETDVEN
jgi:hypothetical protein